MCTKSQIKIKANVEHFVLEEFSGTATLLEISRSGSGTIEQHVVVGELHTIGSHGECSWYYWMFCEV